MTGYDQAHAVLDAARRELDRPDLTPEAALDVLRGTVARVRDALTGPTDTAARAA